jgi:hypothetical protein
MTISPLPRPRASTALNLCVSLGCSVLLFFAAKVVKEEEGTNEIQEFSGKGKRKHKT